MSSRPPIHEALEHGIFMYLCSGEMHSFPAATSVDLTDGMFEVRDHALLVASFGAESVWCCSLSETSPSLG